MRRYLWISFWILAGCATTRQNKTEQPVRSAVTDGKLFASVFQQRAAEYRALCLQSYQLARWRLDEALRTLSVKPKAIITDIDETVLDNSVYQLQQVSVGKDYESVSWQEWTSKGVADTLPGSASFLSYASSKGVRIFYLTNRDEKERAGTMKNLQHFRLPDADAEHLIMRQTSSSKEARRQEVMKNFEVILLIGDNLADFDSAFDKKPEEERKQQVNRLAGEFGSRYILLPNPVYGDWETSIYQYQSGLSLAQKDSVLRSLAKKR